MEDLIKTPDGLYIFTKRLLIAAVADHDRYTVRMEIHTNSSGAQIGMSCGHLMTDGALTWDDP